MLKIEVDAGHVVSALTEVPDRATACLVLAHGAGAGMTHPFMAAVAEGLAARRVATLRYQFPFAEAGARRPDRPALARSTVRAAVAAAASLVPALPLFAGGKSFGGRMTSQAQAETALPGILGLVFLGFPLHAPKQPAIARADHLADIAVPLLFLQGTRDTLADLSLLAPVVERLGSAATLATFEGADHSFHVPARSGRSDAEVLAAVLDRLADWIERVVGAR